MPQLTRAALFLALASAACADWRPVPASCGSVSTRGGDIVGDWAFAGSCVSTSALFYLYEARFGTSCPPEVTVTDDVTLTYVPTMISFNADGTYAGRFSLSGSIRLRFPGACLTGTCADLHEKARAMVAPGGDFTAASCANKDTDCACSLTLGRLFSQTGTYTADGFDLMTRPEEGPVTRARYSVAEPELHLMTFVPTVAAQDAALSLASDIVLVRQ